MTASAVFCKDFKDISYENASARILEESMMWLQIICFVTTSAFWFVKFSKLTTSDCITQVNHYRKTRHCINKFQFFYDWRIKSSKNFPRSHVLPGQFLKNSSGDEIFEQVHLQEMTQMRLIKQVLVKSSLQDRVTKIIPPLLEMVNYLDWLLLIKSLDPLITWSCNIM